MSDYWVAVLLGFSFGNLWVCALLVFSLQTTNRSTCAGYLIENGFCSPGSAQHNIGITSDRIQHLSGDHPPVRLGASVEETVAWIWK